MNSTAIEFVSRRAAWSEGALPGVCADIGQHCCSRGTETGVQKLIWETAHNLLQNMSRKVRPQLCNTQIYAIRKELLHSRQHKQSQHHTPMDARKETRGPVTLETRIRPEQEEVSGPRHRVAPRCICGTGQTTRAAPCENISPERIPLHNLVQQRR